MIDKKILIAVLARDCKKSLQSNIPQIEILRSHFADSRIVVVENDSTDGTKEVLRDWSGNCSKIELIMNDYGTKTIPSVTASTPHPSTSLHRIEKMAYYRNMYLEYARSLEYDFDYLIVIDIDVVSFSVEGVLSSIIHAPSDWGGLFANGQRFLYGKFPYYFDLFAYVSIEDDDVFERKYDELFYASKSVTKQLRNTSYYPCLSAFGGLGIYKWEAVQNFSYLAILNNRCPIAEAVCEHVPFNVQLNKSGYKTYICKDMKLNYGARSLRQFIIASLLPLGLYKFFFKLKKGYSYGS